MNAFAGLAATCAPAMDAHRIKKVGHITPSTNTTMEPLTTLLGALSGGGISQHFSRVSVRRLALDDEAASQFELERMLAAARILGEAPLDAIVWNGTAGSWRGRAFDTQLVAAIEAETGIRATTSTLAIYDTFRRHGWTRIGLAVPYNDGITDAIVREYATHGFEVVATANLGLESNIDFGNTPAATIRELLVAAAAGAPDCIAVVCTNVPAITLAAEFEAAYGIPIVDSIAVTFLEAARLCGLDPRVAGFGRVLAGD
jgi:maleate isomerase